MANTDIQSWSIVELRRKAEEKARTIAAIVPENIVDLSPEQTFEMLHELRVHQIELEMQNEELRRAQAALDSSRAHYFNLYDLSPVGYCTIRKDSQIIEANLTFVSMLGYTRDFLYGQLFHSFVYSTDQDRYYLERKKLYETEKAQECELRMVKKDGTPVWVLLESNMVTDPGGEGLCRMVIHDIGTRKETEKTLHESEAKYQLFFAGAGDAIIIHDERGRILEVNELASSRMGYTCEEMTAMTVDQIDSPNESLYASERIIRLMENGRHSFETVHQTRDGQLIPTEVNAKKIEWKGKPAMMSICRDISKHKKDELEIRNLLQEKEIILKEVHHRIKNNMNMVYGLLYLQANAQADQVTQNILNEAAGRVKSMMVLYDKLYRSDKYDGLNLKYFLSSLVLEIIAQFSGILNVDTDIRIEDVVVSTDKLSPLGIIINELITNSMKHAFSNSNRGILRISADKDGSMITVVYQDNGIGLPEEEAIKNAGGFGMELVSGLMQQIQGTISIDRNNGTKYVIVFEE